MLQFLCDPSYIPVESRFRRTKRASRHCILPSSPIVKKLVIGWDSLLILNDEFHEYMLRMIYVYVGNMTTYFSLFVAFLF